MFYNTGMGTAVHENKKIDMICQHNADGTMIPLKLRMKDEDGAYQEYKIKAYKDLTYKGIPFDRIDDSRVHSSDITPFECKIECFGHERTIRLFYNSYEHTWMLSPRQ